MILIPCTLYIVHCPPVHRSTRRAGLHSLSREISKTGLYARNRAGFPSRRREIRKVTVRFRGVLYSLAGD